MRAGFLSELRFSLSVLSVEKLLPQSPRRRNPKNAKKYNPLFRETNLRTNAFPRYASAMRTTKFAVAVLAAFFLTVFLLAQQAATSSVAIIVKDQSGAPIPHAHIRLVPAPNPAPTMETDDKGILSLNLKPGGYALFIHSQGFKEFAIHLEVHDEVHSEAHDAKDVQTMPVVLQVGSYSGPEVLSLPSKDSLQLGMYPYHDAVTLSVADLKAMPHSTVTVHNSHSNADETYSGVRLADLLSKYGAPLGSELHGEALALYVVATGSDGYKAVFALAEIDPSFHPGEFLVADAMDGKPLDAHNGPFKLVVTEDKRPARSVRNLVSILLESAR